MSNDENAIALGSLAELIAKCGAAMCMGALCTAFVFDYTLWLIVDPRMLSYFDLVDHIQTAVQIFGIGSIALAAAWILMFVVVYAASPRIGLTSSGKSQRLCCYSLYACLCSVF
jgi:hypothetical protein